MKVVVVSPNSDPTNGWGNITYELCRRLAEEVDLTIALPKGQRTDIDTKVVHFTAPLRFPSKNPLFYLRLFSSSLKLPKADITHSLFSYPYAVPAALSAKRFIMGAQGTFGVRPFKYLRDRYLLKWAYWKAKAVIVPSEYTKKRVVENTGISTVKVIPNAVDFGRFSRKLDISTLERKFRPGKIILSVGALKPRKGQYIMIEAFRRIKREVPDAKYLIIGSGTPEYTKELKDMARGVSDIYFLGQKRGDDLVRYYQLCDVYAHTPVNTDDVFEGFGIVYLEAGACGKPVVGSYSGGVPSAILDGKTGLMAPEGDADKTAEAVIRLLEDKDLAASMSEANKIWAKKNEWGNYTKKILGIYDEVCNG